MNVTNLISYNLGSLTFIGIIVLIWTFIIKGMALWRAARREQKGWFVALLIINTLGILELVYLLVIARNDQSVQPTAPTTR